MTTDAARYLAARNLRDAILTRPTHERDHTMSTPDEMRRQATRLLAEAEQLDKQADAATPGNEDEMQAFARSLFTPDEVDDAEAVDKIPNHVPKEGNTSPPPPGDDMREFTRALFDN